MIINSSTATDSFVVSALAGISVDSRFAACVLIVLLNGLPAFSDERPAATITGAADEFPEFNLPKLSGEDSSASSARPANDEDRKGISTPGRRPPRESLESPFDPSLPLDPVVSEPLDEDRSPFRKRKSSDSSNGISTPENLSDAERDALPPLTDQDAVDGGAFDWTLQPVSIADVETGREWLFEHGKANLTETESEEYVGLIRAVINQKNLAPAQLSENVNLTSAWETAFYRFSAVRQRAWGNGKVQLRSKTTIAEPDVFGSGSSKILSATDQVFDAQDLKAYSLEVDMQVHPGDFVGRPVVLYGLFTPFGAVELQAKRTLEGEERIIALQRGFLKNLSNTQTIAIVDAISYVDPQSQKDPLTAWPVGSRIAIPVLVKGWFVKLWGQRPLIFTDVARILTPRPYDEHIRDHVRSRRRIADDESWLYYETLRQLQVTSHEVQAALADVEQQTRVKELMQEVRDKAGADRLVLENELRSGTIGRISEVGKEGYETRRTRLERQVMLREDRYRRYEKNPESFPAFVDVFENPDRWQGRLVTLRGHVRRVTTYNGDSTLFDGQPLHELWLFTSDSQQNPAVIVTPSLPPDFPVSAEFVDSVTVTGCFFKMYHYRSQHDNRLSPLLLAGSLSWNPTAADVLSLAASGNIPANSPLVATARSQSRSLSDTVILMLGIVGLLMAMTVWGRVQRDRRERRRLMSLVDERPDFRQTSQDLFSGPFADLRIEPTRG